MKKRNSPGDCFYVQPGIRTTEADAQILQGIIFLGTQEMLREGLCAGLKPGALDWRREEGLVQRLIKGGLIFISCPPTPQGEPRGVSSLGSSRERGGSYKKHGKAKLCVV